MSGRFTKQDRLVRKADFSAVFKHARRDQGPFFTVLYLDNGLGRPRLGLAVSRKVSLLAVRRNRIKRLIREAFRLNKSQLCSHDIVVIARPAAASADKRKLDSSVKRHWHRISRSCVRS